MKTKLFATTICAAAVTSSALAGPPAVESEQTITIPTAAGFDAARRPISNPTLFDLALPRTGVHPIYMHQKMPSRIQLASGKTLALGGDFSVYALQFEYALNDRLSIVATKDGYIDFNPSSSSPLNDEHGFADIAAGVKYAFILDPVKQLAVSGSLVVELYTGDSGVFQGNGEGAVDLSIAALKLSNDWQFAGALGVGLPFDTDDEAVTSFVSAHVGYNVTNRLYALAEVNWYHVISEGNGTSNFAPQLGTTVPNVIGFEGGDLINFGASNPASNIVTAAVGVRYKLTDNADLGLAYEIPLTDEQENLMKSRITLDLVYTF